MGDRLVVETALLLAALVTVQYPFVFARRLTLLPLSTAGLVAFLISRVAGDGSEGWRLVLAYATGGAVSVLFSMLVLVVSEPRNILRNIATSLIGISATTLLIVTIDPVGGSIGIDTRAFMLGSPRLAAVGGAASVLGYWLLYVWHLRSPLYAAWTVASGSDGGAALVPASSWGLLISLACHLGLGSFLIAALSIHRGVITGSDLGFGFLFDVLASTLFINAVVMVGDAATPRHQRLWRGGACLLGALLVIALTALLRNVNLGTAFAGEWRRLFLWAIAVGTLTLLPRLQTGHVMREERP